MNVRVEEQHDRDGDLLYAVTIVGVTYDRRALDALAAAIGGQLTFVSPGRELPDDTAINGKVGR